MRRVTPWSLRSQENGEHSFTNKHVHTQPIPDITFLGLVKQPFSKPCLERKFRNMTSPIPLSNAATIWGVVIWLDDSAHFCKSAALQKPMRSSRITEAVRLLWHNSQVRNSWELPNANDLNWTVLEHRCPKLAESTQLQPQCRNQLVPQSMDFKHIRAQTEQLVEVPAGKVITTCGTASNSNWDTILALKLPWNV